MFHKLLSSSTNPFDKKTDNELGACSLQRTCSASSLTANVDENFEIDQVMTLAECDSVNVTYNSSGSGELIEHVKDSLN